MPHTPVPDVGPGDFGKASWADAVRLADADLTARVTSLEAATGSGSVTGPVSTIDNAIMRADGTSGTAIQGSNITIADAAAGTLSGTNSGDVTLAGTPNYLTIAAQVITRALIDLASHVTGRLPLANLVQVTAGRLLGRASASGTGDAQEISLGVGLAWNGTAIDCTVVPTAGSDTSSRLISGGGVVWTSAYNFRVSAATYQINGTQYSSAEQTVTLTAAHASLDRIDVIAVDDTGTVVVVTGTAAAQPSEPDVDHATQLKLGLVFVAASSSAPTVTDTTLYTENAGGGGGEWNWTTGGGSGFTLGSTNNPHGGTKDIEGTTVAAGAYAIGTKPSGTLVITDYAQLIFFIRSKVTWNSNRSLQIQFRNSTVAVGVPVTFKHNTFNFDSSNTTTYQQIAIPITAFAIPAGSVINDIRLMDSGGSIGFYLDDMTLQSGGSSNVTSGITQDEADARYVQRPGTVTDTAIAVWNGTSGSAAKNSVITIDNTGVLGLPDGVRQTFNPNATNAGLNVGAQAGDPSTPSDGDIWYNSSSGLLKARINGATVTLGATAAAPVRTITAVFDGGGSALTASSKTYVGPVPYSGTISKVTILSIDGAVTSGSIVIDVWKKAYTSYPPTVSDTITASAKPTVSSAIKSQDTTLTGWSKTVNVGDTFGFNIDSITSFTKVAIVLEVS